MMPSLPIRLQPQSVRKEAGDLHRLRYHVQHVHTLRPVARPTSARVLGAWGALSKVCWADGYGSK